MTGTLYASIAFLPVGTSTPGLLSLDNDVVEHRAESQDGLCGRSDDKNTRPTYMVLTFIYYVGLVETEGI
jgi:hypothetical protein